MEKVTDIFRRAQSRPSNEISPNIPPVPDAEEAMILSSLIDRARMAMGWNRLPQSNSLDENSEQDVAIITWYEILLDAGVPREYWTDCYRSAQRRKSELKAQGHEAGIVTPNDLVVEWPKVRRKIDRTHLLPENAAAACQRCYGTGREEMPDGSVKESCDHRPLTREEEIAREAARRHEVREQAEKMRASLRPPAPKLEIVKPKAKGQALLCSECGRKDNTLGGLWYPGDACNWPTVTMKPDGSLVACAGRMEIAPTRRTEERAASVA